MDKKDIHLHCEWRIADDGPPENPLQALVMSLCRTSKDMGEQNDDNCKAAIEVSWNETLLDKGKS